MDESIKLIRQTQAENRSEFTDKVIGERERDSELQPAYEYQGKNADTGEGVIKSQGGDETVTGQVITNGSIKEGQSVCVGAAPGLMTINQMPCPKPSPETQQKPQQTEPYWIAIGNKNFLSRQTVYIGSDAECTTFKEVQYPDGETMFPGGYVLDFCRSNDAYYLLGVYVSSDYRRVSIAIAESTDKGESWTLNKLDEKVTKLSFQRNSPLQIATGNDVVVVVVTDGLIVCPTSNLEDVKFVELLIESGGSNNRWLFFYEDQFWLFENTGFRNREYTYDGLVRIYRSENGEKWEKVSNLNYYDHQSAVGKDVLGWVHISDQYISYGTPSDMPSGYLYTVIPGIHTSYPLILKSEEIELPEFPNGNFPLEEIGRDLIRHMLISSNVGNLSTKVAFDGESSFLVYLAHYSSQFPDSSNFNILTFYFNGEEWQQVSGPTFGQGLPAHKIRYSSRAKVWAALGYQGGIASSIASSISRDGMNWEETAAIEGVENGFDDMWAIDDNPLTISDVGIFITSVT